MICLAVGDNTAASIIWVAGEAKGHNVAGGLVNAPTATSGFLGQDTAYLAAAKAYTDVLRAALVASGIKF